MFPSRVCSRRHASLACLRMTKRFKNRWQMLHLEACCHAQVCAPSGAWGLNWLGHWHDCRMLLGMTMATLQQPATRTVVDILPTINDFNLHVTDKSVADTAWVPAFALATQFVVSTFASIYVAVVRFNDSKMFNRDNKVSEATCRQCQWFCNLTGMTPHASVDHIRTFKLLPRAGSVPLQVALSASVARALLWSRCFFFKFPFKLATCQWMSPPLCLGVSRFELSRSSDRKRDGEAAHLLRPASESYSDAAGGDCNCRIGCQWQ